LILIVTCFITKINSSGFAEESTCDLKIQKVKFFESDTTLPAEADREYNYSFPQSKTRFIWCEIKLENFLFHKSIHRHIISWQYYTPDGSLMGEAKTDITVKPDWDTFSLENALGWSQAGKWDLGRYVVFIFVDGLKIGEADFFIHDDAESERI
jgi:hypothetical protein